MSDDADYPRKKGFLADLFTGPRNEGWDLGRVMAFLAIWPMFAATVYNIYVGLTIKQFIDFMALGGGIAAIYTAVALLIASKDYFRTKDKASEAVNKAAVKLAENVNAAAILHAENGGEPATIVEGDLKAEHIENVEVKK